MAVQRPLAGLCVESIHLHLGEIDEHIFEILLDRADEKLAAGRRIRLPQGREQGIVAVQAEAGGERGVVTGAGFVALDLMLQGKERAESPEALDSDALASMGRLRGVDAAGVLVAGQQHPGRPQAAMAPKAMAEKTVDGMEADPPAGMTAGGIGDVLPRGGGWGLRVGDMEEDDPGEGDRPAAGISPTPLTTRPVRQRACPVARTALPCSGLYGQRSVGWCHGGRGFGLSSPTISCRLRRAPAPFASDHRCIGLAVASDCMASNARRQARTSAEHS